MNINLNYINRLATLITDATCPSVRTNDREVKSVILGHPFRIALANLPEVGVNVKVFVGSQDVGTFLWQDKNSETQNYQDMVNCIYRNLAISALVHATADVEPKIREAINRFPQRVELPCKHYIETKQMRSPAGFCSINLGDEEGSLSSGPVNNTDHSTTFMLASLTHRISAMPWVADRTVDFEVDFDKLGWK